MWWTHIQQHKQVATSLLNADVQYFECSLRIMHSTHHCHKLWKYSVLQSQALNSWILYITLWYIRDLIQMISTCHEVLWYRIMAGLNMKSSPKVVYERPNMCVPRWTPATGDRASAREPDSWAGELGSRATEPGSPAPGHLVVWHTSDHSANAALYNLQNHFSIAINVLIFLLQAVLPVW